MGVMLHTGYKVALFVLPTAGETHGSLVFLAAVTIGGGIAFGVMRQWSKSVVAALAGHVVFDLMVYGDRLGTPWWVWR